MLRGKMYSLHSKKWRNNTTKEKEASKEAASFFFWIIQNGFQLYIIKVERATTRSTILSGRGVLNGCPKVKLLNIRILKENGLKTVRLLIPTTNHIEPSIRITDMFQIV